jgi:hypothetical protein
MRCGVTGKDDVQPRWQHNPFIKQLPVTSMKISLVGASSMKSRVVALSCMLIDGCSNSSR